MVEAVYISNPDYQFVLQEILDPDRLCTVTKQQMAQISLMSTPPGVLALCVMPKEDPLPESIKGHRIFYLDDIRDPGNMGTILRIADWFGLDFVMMSPDCVDIYNHKVLQASMGSALRVKTCVLDRVGLMAISEGKLYACDMAGKSIKDMPPPEDGIIVFGNESVGVSDEIMHKIREVISIPGDYSLGAESLNVATAAAIVAAWWRAGG